MPSPGGIQQGRTVERLATVREATSGTGENIRALQEAFASMSMVRLEHHAKLIEKSRSPHNVLDTEKLRPLTRVSLQEALRVVAAAQKLLP